MEEELISLVTAQLASQKGFNWKVKNQWLAAVNNTLIEESFKDYTITPYKYGIARPTQSLLQKWLREVHNIHIEFCHNDQIGYRVWVKVFPDKMSFVEKNENIFFNTYEEALEEALLQALKLIKR